MSTDVSRNYEVFLATVYITLSLSGFPVEFYSDEWAQMTALRG